MTDITAFDQGIADARAAASAHTRKGKPKPSRVKAARSGDQIAYLRGWAAGMREHAERRSHWREEEIMEGVTLAVYEDRPREFWADTGPYFALRSVRTEMPYLVDDEGYVWFVARKGEQFAGMASVHIDAKGTGYLHGLYVVPELRSNGIADRLIEARLAYLREKGCILAATTANALSAPLLVRHGFSVKAPGKEYSKLEMILAPPSRPPKAVKIKAKATA